MLTFGSKVLSFFALVCIQTVVALLFKLSQRDAHYTYAPSSAQTSAEVIKLVISCALLTRVVHADARPDVELGSSNRHYALAFRAWVRFRQDISRRLVVALGGLAALYCFNNQLAFTSRGKLGIMIQSERKKKEKERARAARRARARPFILRGAEAGGGGRRRRAGALH